ncbi:MAG: Gx transporter family protein [Solobacterium sp.]|nr:Gx transporter family protein [Solobacterium sp.]MCH4206594.1 Gx transporter family protein [Solobacterium sp.]MCH4227794.1 Gx transporter family protein [Solobacterium sp.]MCH4283314.1 Gx transporter family protein [Solobacterium sp.]
MRMNQTRHFTYLALLSAMAITLNLLETAMIPPLFGVFRIGLANIIALVTLKILGVKEMIIVNIMRVMIGNLLSGRIFGSAFWISFGGVLISTLILILMDKLHSSLMFTSVMSAIGHSTGQVIVVMIFYMQPLIAAILPYFLALSIPTGLATGFIAKIATERVKPLKKAE